MSRKKNNFLSKLMKDPGRVKAIGPRGDVAIYSTSDANPGVEGSEGCRKGGDEVSVRKIFPNQTVASIGRRLRNYLQRNATDKMADSRFIHNPLILPFPHRVDIFLLIPRRVPVHVNF